MSLLDKIRKNSLIKETAVLSKSVFFTEKDMVATDIPMINVALSGALDGGLSPGVTMWAGPSKNFKSFFSLILAAAYLNKHKDAVLMYLDTEFGTPISYFNTLNIDMDRVVHIPITDVEQLKFEVVNQLHNIDRGDKVIIVIDSIGNLASKKELDDAMDAKSVADMSRAKGFKSFFRMVTPHLSLKDIPMVVVNHTYKSLDFYSKDVVGGGQGSYYASDNIFILGRQQEKDGTELVGFNFIINVEKSRYVKEKSKIPITVNFEGGISKYSGLIDIAEESGYVIKPAKGWYSKVNKITGEVEDKKYRFKDTNTKEFWDSILNNTGFQEWVKHRFQIGSSYSIETDSIELGENYD